MGHSINGIEIGDVVSLKSGGPDMTVVGLGLGGSEREVSCVWFHSTAATGEGTPLYGNVCNHFFPSAVLTKKVI